MSLTMNDQPSEQSRNKADKIKERLLKLLEMNSFEHLPIKSWKLQRMFNITDIVVRQAVGKLRDDGHPIGSGKNGFQEADGQLKLL